MRLIGAESQISFSLDKLIWILDTWISSDGNVKNIESWNKVNDKLFEGSSETIQDGDIVFSEKLKIIYLDCGIYYVADVKNNPAPVYFKLISQTDDESSFGINCMTFRKRLLTGMKKVPFMHGLKARGKILNGKKLILL